MPNVLWKQEEGQGYVRYFRCIDGEEFTIIQIGDQAFLQDGDRQTRHLNVREAKKAASRRAERRKRIREL